MLLAPLFALSLTAQFTEGPAVSSQGCVSAFTGSQTTIVASTVAAQRHDAAHEPRQGAVFTVLITVAASPQPCASHLVVRPGFRLPPGVELAVPTAGSTTPAPRCFMGPPNNLVSVACPARPTETRFDGTLIYDAPVGFWRIPDGQRLQIQIPVRSELVQNESRLEGFVDFAAFDFSRAPLRPTVGVRVFQKSPLVQQASPSSRDVGAFAGTVRTNIANYHLAGRVSLELGRWGQALTVVDEADIGPELFVTPLEAGLVELEADTSYQFRWNFQAAGSSTIVRGLVHTFTTLPAPRHPVTMTLEGEGTILTDVQPDESGTFAERTVVSLRAEAAPGHQLQGFTVNGAPVAGDATTVFVAGPIDVRAHFEPVPPATADEAFEPTPAADPAVTSEEARAEELVEEEVSEQDTRAVTPGIRISDGDDAGADDDDDRGDDGAGGCAATPPAALPFGVLALALGRRRRAR
jgi:uncharacterized protein (TIGR03382 family)